MTDYEKMAGEELDEWIRDIQAPSSFIGSIARKAQGRINKLIPEKVHVVITAAIREMTRGVIFGAGFITGSPEPKESLELTETKVIASIANYSKAAAAEGGITGAGGFLLGLVDFPLWLTLKLKMLFEIARLYGYDTNEFRERIYLLHIFQLAFSSQQHKNKVFAILEDWPNQSLKFESATDFDWRSFQQEYRDSIDLAKLFQLIPGIGAAVGVLVNHRLTKKLGKTAMNAYRIRMRKRIPSSTSV